MSNSHLLRAQHVVQDLLEKTDVWRKETYSAVHDQIGSTLSAASIQAKLLHDEVKDPIEKDKVGKIHATIKECMTYVTDLNKRLKSGWAPSSRESFFQDLQRELTSVGAVFNVEIIVQTQNDFSRRLQFAEMMALHEGCIIYIKHAVSRMATKVHFSWNVDQKKLECLCSDDGALEIEPHVFKPLRIRNPELIDDKIQKNDAVLILKAVS